MEEINRLKYSVLARDKEIKRLKQYIRDLSHEQEQIYKVIGALLVYAFGVGTLKFNVPAEKLLQLAEQYKTEIKLNEKLEYMINVEEKGGEENGETAWQKGWNKAG